MASQKSNAAPAAAREPKRERGRLRVTAILDAAAAVFGEKGYDAATMTEIAARANTAIGSLYQFFPTKEVLADALLAWYVELLGKALDAIAQRAARLSPSELADAFIDFMLDLQSERAAAIALVEARSDIADKRTMLRGATRRQIATILVIATGGALPEAKASSMAVLLLHVLKAVPAFVQEEAGTRESLVDEARGLARLYISHAFGGGADCRPSNHV
jgi:AcrR family transcriptional regulator